MGQNILRGGLVGCGVVSNESHLPAWRSIKNAEIVAVCDINAEAASTTAKRWGIHGIYTDLSQMLRKEKLSFIDICTPPFTHFQVAAQAIEVGLHVLIEKPITVSLKEAEEIVRISNKSGTKLCVVHHALFYPVFKTARSMIDSGKIGKLTSVDINLRIPGNKIQGKNHWYHTIPGGVIGEHAPHAAYLILSLLGNIRSVKAMFNKCGPVDWVIFDELKVLLEGEKGIGTFSISGNAPVFSFTMDISGSRETIHVDFVTQTLTRAFPRSNRSYGMVLRYLDANWQNSASVISVVETTLLNKKWYKSGHQNLFHEFVESIQNGVETPVTAENGRDVVKVLEQIWSQMS
ncbi:MAG TPA: Gfo/Idh/MocA family oxidoreductase [Dehalococcoidales bacterium]